jgi:S-adenosylmethionine/arginine decarboxylase-like enzyme
LKRFNEGSAWGLSTSIDIWDCNPETIRDPLLIETYIIQLCDLIKMKRFAQPKIVYFGEDERVQGYSMIQLIETSTITGHFANATERAYIDIFSCKLYDPYKAAHFTKQFFEGDKVQIYICIRE